MNNTESHLRRQSNGLKPIGIILALFLSLIIAGSVSAQYIPSPSGGDFRPPVIGGSPGAPLPKVPLISGSQSLDVMRHRDLSGKPCLTVYGFAQPYTTNPNLFDHVITASNNCPTVIKMQVCYYDTRDCIAMEVPSKRRVDAVLGTFPSMKDFRYEFRERF